MKIGFLVALAAALAVSNLTQAAEIKVLSTQATEEAYNELVPQFEKATGHKVTTVFTGTLGANKRIAAGEAYDLLIMSGGSIDEHIKGGKAAPGSRVDLAKSGVGVAVKAGAPKPSIKTVADLKATLLSAKSIGYSTGPSGNYMLTLFDKLGIADQVKPKLKQTPTGVFVGSIIASGEVEIGFQQVSELSHFKGIDFVGPLPEEVQNYTTFASALFADSKQADAAKALQKFLAAKTSGDAYKKRGMVPTS